MAALTNPFDTLAGTVIAASRPELSSMQVPATVNTVTPGAQIPSASKITAYPQLAPGSQTLVPVPGGSARVHPIGASYVSKAQPVVLRHENPFVTPSMVPVQAPAVAQAPSQMPVLPPAYGQYTYGERMVSWRRVPVPENNTGIMRNAEFPTKPYQEGVEVSASDDAVRNSGWRHLGRWAMPVAEKKALIPDPHRETADMMSRRLAEAYYKTTELVPDWEGMERDYEPFKAAVPDFKALKAARDGPLVGLTLGKAMTIDIVGDEQLAEFFADPEASLEDNVDF